MSKPPKSIGRPSASRLAASVYYAGNSRQLASEESDFARLFVRHWRVARNVVIRVYGEGSTGTPAGFRPGDVANERYARLQSHKYDPNTMGRCVWSKLDHSELDLIYLVEALVAEGDQVAAVDGAALLLDGLRFTVTYHGDTPHLGVEKVRELAGPAGTN
jgi:hypothetical protein